MAYETEAKILEVDPGQLELKLDGLGAKLVLDTKLIVDWFELPGVKEGNEPWYLRIRSDSEGKMEVTWKGEAKILGSSARKKEINLVVADRDKSAQILAAIGLEPYAHQEKFRRSWIYEDWRFDLDQYPSMPPYLEIEGEDESHIQEAIALLGLQGHGHSSAGERILIQEQYGLDWYNMRFDL